MTKAGFVYVMRRVDGIRKVGLTVNVSGRRNYCSYEHGGAFSTECVWEMDYDAAVAVERTVHSALKPERYIEDGREELYDLPLEYLCGRIEGILFALSNGFIVAAPVFHRGWRKPSQLKTTDDQIRAAIPLGTTNGARKVGLSVSTFIRRRRAIERAESDAKQP